MYCAAVRRRLRGHGHGAAAREELGMRPLLPAGGANGLSFQLKEQATEQDELPEPGGP